MYIAGLVAVAVVAFILGLRFIVFRAPEAPGTASPSAAPRERRLSKGAADALFKDLSSEVGSVSVTSPLGDAEAQRLAIQLEELFRGAGWQTVGVAQGIFSSPPIGIRLSVRDAALPGAENALRSLARAGLNPIGVKNEKQDNDRVEIVVGSRPLDEATGAEK